MDLKQGLHPLPRLFELVQHLVIRKWTRHRWSALGFSWWAFFKNLGLCFFSLGCWIFWSATKNNSGIIKFLALQKNISTSTSKKEELSMDMCHDISWDRDVKWKRLTVRIDGQPGQENSGTSWGLVSGPELDVMRGLCFVMPD